MLDASRRAQMRGGLREEATLCSTVMSDEVASRSFDFSEGLAPCINPRVEGARARALACSPPLSSLHAGLGLG